MIVTCMSKEIQDEDKIKVYLVTPYEREMGTKGNTTISGTYEETKHIIVGREYEVNLVEIKEVALPMPVFVKDFLKSDPVTIAVDKCNEIFASNELTKDLFVDVVGTPAEGTDTPYGRRNGKLYTAETLKKVEELESRVTPKEELFNPTSKFKIGDQICHLSAEDKTPSKIYAIRGDQYFVDKEETVFFTFEQNDDLVICKFVEEAQAGFGVDEFAINEKSITIQGKEIPMGYKCNPVRATEFYGYIVYFYDGEDQANTDKVIRLDVKVHDKDIIVKIERTFNCKFEIL